MFRTWSKAKLRGVVNIENDNNHDIRALLIWVSQYPRPLVMYRKLLMRFQSTDGTFNLMVGDKKNKTKNRSPKEKRLVLQ